MHFQLVIIIFCLMKAGTLKGGLTTGMCCSDFWSGGKLVTHPNPVNTSEYSATMALVLFVMESIHDTSLISVLLLSQRTFWHPSTTSNQQLCIAFCLHNVICVLPHDIILCSPNLTSLVLDLGKGWLLTWLWDTKWHCAPVSTVLVQEFLLIV